VGICFGFFISDLWSRMREVTVNRSVLPVALFTCKNGFIHMNIKGTDLQIVQLVTQSCSCQASLTLLSRMGERTCDDISHAYLLENILQPYIKWATRKTGCVTTITASRSVKR